MKKATLQNVLLFTITLVVMLIASEFVFRKIIFNDKGTFKELKDAGKYCNPLSEDYWKLNYYFETTFLPPENPHPLLGWKGYFNPDNYQHADFIPDDKRIKTLIFGDSFIMCVDTVKCFQHILNNDSSFTKANFLLNYGVGGYGVDQIYMLCSLTVTMYDNPFVIFSIMPTDMDRSILKFRIGQKPYYEIENNQLALKGIPVLPKTEDYIKSNPVSFSSYLYQRYKYSNLNIFRNSEKEDEPYRKKIIELNSKIILDANQMLKSKNLNYVFLIFDNMYNTDGEWRLQFLRKFLSDNNIPHFVSSDLAWADKTFGKYDFNNYIIKGNGHPTTHYNQLVCHEIKRWMGIQSTEIISHKNTIAKTNSTQDIEYWKNKITSDADWLNAVKKKAEQRNIPLDSMVTLDAIWMINQSNSK